MFQLMKWLFLLGAALIVAFVFGQFNFFWKQEKKILRRLGFGKFLNED